MKPILAHLLRRLACHLDGHCPVDITAEVTSCGACGVALFSRGGITRRVGEVFDEVVREVWGKKAPRA